MRKILSISRQNFSASSVFLLLAATVVLTGCGRDKREEARKAIKQSGHSFIAEDFIKAAGRGDQGLTASFLVAGMDKNAQDNRGYTALMAAAETGQNAVLKSLLDENAKPDLQNKEGETALLLAAAKDHPDTVRTLVEANADPRIKDRKNWTPLMKAVFSGYKDIADVLLKTSADQLKRDGQLDRALAVSSLLGNAELMRALLDRGANINASIEKGQTALMYAAAAGNMDAATFLLDRGADTRLLNAEGANASVLALQKGHPDMSKYIDSRTSTGPAAIAAGNTSSPSPSPSAAAVAGGTPGGPPPPVPTEAETKQFKADAASVALEKAWLKQNGVEPTNLLNKDLGQDDDHDGFTNDEELAGGTNPNDPSSHPPFYTKLRMKRVDGDNFPVVFDGIEGKKIRVTVREKSADANGTANNRQFSLNPGDRVADLPFTVSRVKRRNISEKDTGKPSDVSELTLANVQTGQKVVLIRAMPTNSPDASAIVSFGSQGEEMSLRQGQKFTLPQDPQTRYEVLDIRPTQIILRILNSGQTITVPLRDHGSDSTAAIPLPAQ